jgi:hypothetical protein
MDRQFGCGFVHVQACPEFGYRHGVLDATLFAIAWHATRRTATKLLDRRNILVSKQSVRVTHRIRRRHGRSYAVSPGSVIHRIEVAHSMAAWWCCAKRLGASASPP